MKIEVKRGPKCFSIEGACVDIDWLILGMIQNNTYIITDELLLLIHRTMQIVLLTL